MPHAEIIDSHHPRGPFRLALWDFDGTLSLYRGGWQQVMIELMVEELAATATAESRAVLAKQAEGWVVTLNGKPTIHQMLKLATEVSARGGSPPAAEEYCRRYQDQLFAVVEKRIADVQQGDRRPLDYGIAGVADMLAALARRDVTLVLASGTEYEYVSRELKALGLQGYFGEHVYAPHGHDTSFSKAGIIATALRELNISGEQLVGFGDGIVETTEVVRVGGCAVGVASDEHGGPGPDAHKRRRLIEAGAQLVVPNFLCHEALLEQLGI